ncbi:hypothetical protein D3C87_664120 [compost metagenome]
MASLSLFEKINIRGYVEGWAKMTIEIWKKELRKKKIGISRELEASFSEKVWSRASDVLNTQLKFSNYGRYVDMGVGKGLKAYERGTNRQNYNDQKRYGLKLGASRRKAKRWLNKIRTHQIYRLSELLSKKASQQIISDFATTQNIKIDFNG